MRVCLCVSMWACVCVTVYLNKPWNSVPQIHIIGKFARLMIRLYWGFFYYLCNWPPFRTVAILSPVWRSLLATWGLSGPHSSLVAMHILQKLLSCHNTNHLKTQTRVLLCSVIQRPLSPTNTWHVRNTSLIALFYYSMNHKPEHLLEHLKGSHMIMNFSQRKPSWKVTLLLWLHTNLI